MPQSEEGIRSVGWTFGRTAAVVVILLFLIPALPLLLFLVGLFLLFSPVIGPFLIGWLLIRKLARHSPDVEGEGASKEEAEVSSKADGDDADAKPAAQEAAPPRRPGFTFPWQEWKDVHKGPRSEELKRMVEPPKVQEANPYAALDGKSMESAQSISKADGVESEKVKEEKAEDERKEEEREEKFNFLHWARSQLARK